MAQSSIPVVFSRKIIHPHLNSELHHFGVFNFLRWATVKIRGLKCFASRIFERIFMITGKSMLTYCAPRCDPVIKME